MKNKVQEIMNLWEKGFGQTEIAKTLQLSTGYVSVTIRKVLGNNYTKRFIYKKRKYKVNENFFDEINTEIKAYFLGLLAADGNISQNIVRISLHEKDQELLEKFCSYIEFDASPKLLLKTKEKGWNRSNQYLVAICSKTMTQSLKKQGIFPNKSLTLLLPTTLNNELFRHFIRGYFDGDGCIYVNKNNKAEVSIAGNTFFCEELKNKLLDIKIKSSVSKHSSNNCFYTRIYGKNNILKFYNFLYKDAEMYLNRKKIIFDNWLDKSQKVNI